MWTINTNFCIFPLSVEWPSSVFSHLFYNFFFKLTNLLPHLPQINKSWFSFTNIINTLALNLYTNSICETVDIYNIWLCFVCNSGHFCFQQAQRKVWASLHPQVSTHVALDHQTYSALAQHTQITWTAQLKCDEHYRVERWRLGLHYIIIQHTYMDN